jgi:ABC-type uncharacterized transport system substrate-binding protein
MLVVLAACAVAGCAAAPPESPDAPATSPVIASPAPTPAPAPVPHEAPAPPHPALPRRDVKIVLERDIESSAAIADAIAQVLPPRQYRVSTVDSASLSKSGAGASPALVIAIGRTAVDAVRAKLPTVPLVFCQVFAFEDLLQGGGPIWGVDSLPPLALQLKSWRAIDPTLRSVALILGERRDGLASAAVEAAGTLGTEVRLETSRSDRETLYLFKRLATQVDGLWLLPDNRVLSPGVLRELLGYAVAHSVGVFTPNESLLRWGALASAVALPADVAATVRMLAERVVTGQTEGLPAMTPLRAADLRVNQAVAAAMGLPRVPQTHWVARDPD